MKFKFINAKIPEIGSIILVCEINKIQCSHIGSVEFINPTTSNMTVLLLDKIGNITVNMTDSWTVLQIPDLQSLRYAYASYCDQNIDKLLIDGYSAFKKNNLL